MNNRRASVILLVCMLLNIVLKLPAQTLDARPKPEAIIALPNRVWSIEILASQGIKKVPSAAHVVLLAEKTAANLSVNHRPSPHILLIYAGTPAADLAYLAPDARVSVLSIVHHPETLYEIWLTGEPTDAAVVLGIAGALNLHYGLGLRTDELFQVRDRICRQLAHSVSVNELRQGEK